MLVITTPQVRVENFNTFITDDDLKN